MKKSILLILTCLLMLVSAQNTQAQTKEETIDWLKEKIKKTGGFSDDDYVTKIIRVTPCEISYEIKNSKEKVKIVSFPVKVNWETITYKRQHMANPPMGITSATSADIVQYKSNGKISYSCCATFKNIEENLTERIIKALRHLASFCEKKKETF